MGVETAGVAAVAVGCLLTGCVAAVIGSAPQSGTAADTRARAPAAADTALSNAVRARIDADARLRAAPIGVSASRGTVTLSGTVASAGLRRSAEQLARTVAGVSTVNNQLEVK
jgi:hyperosmotically inducible protein